MDELWIVGGDGGRSLVPGALLSVVDNGDIRRRRLSGVAAPQQEFRCNIIESRLEDITFENVDFGRCDWKDCRIERATFVGCDLGGASMITNEFIDCRFERCRFFDTGVSDCSFKGCDFDACDLTSIIVKSSRFEDCGFAYCTTSNRIIESSLLLRTEWTGMELAVAIITGNFGLRQSELIECRVVSKIGSEEQILQSSALAIRDLSAIERYRLAYFWTEQVDGDVAALEAALDLRNWNNDAVVQASFGAQLSGFSQFLLALYNLNEVPIYPLLILHSRNFGFLEWLSSREDLLPLYQVVAGIHLTLTRVIDAFVLQLTIVSAFFANVRPLHFAAEGPVDSAHFQRWFVEQGLDGVQVVSVRPRNSPVDLATTFADHSGFIGTIALFLACRTRVELTRLATASEPTSPSPAEDRQSLVAFSAGFSKAAPAQYEINVQTILPRSLLLDLHLAVNVAVFVRARAILVGILMPGTGEAVPPHLPAPKAGRSRRRSPPG